MQRKSMMALATATLVLLTVAAFAATPLASAEADNAEAEGFKHIDSTWGTATVFAPNKPPQRVDASLHLLAKKTPSQILIIEGTITIGGHVWYVKEANLVSGSDFISLMQAEYSDILTAESDQNVLSRIACRKTVIQLKLIDKDGNTAYAALGGHRNPNGELTLRAAGFSRSLWKMAVAQFRAIVS